MIFTAREIEIGRKLFAGEFAFFAGADKPDALPKPNGIEVAFAGRSNVGKSSLINALTNRKALARVSITPGRTQQINFFQSSGPLVLVDLPGYGFAKAAKERVKAWTGFVRVYLQKRANLGRVIVLVDARHGVKRRRDAGRIRQGRRELHDRAHEMRCRQGRRPAGADRGDAGRDRKASRGIPRSVPDFIRNRRRYRRTPRRDRAAHGRAGLLTEAFRAVRQIS
jgi:GTP-binding protein EngB required for normal cell division